MVCDASANNPSLNDCLHKGDNLVPLMLDVLIRFRAYKVALVSDIKKAFLNVAVQEKDRNFLRILWLDDIHKPSPQIVVNRFARVIFGMNASLFLLVVTVWKHLQKYKDLEPELVAYILRCLYVDDHVGGQDDVQDALRLYKRLKQVFAEAGFDL